MRTPHLLLALTLTSVPLIAQKAPQPSVVILNARNLSQGCPIGFAAERRATPATQFAADGSRSNAPRVHVTFTPGSTASIVKARLTAYGVPPGPHFTPAGLEEVPEITEIFQLVRRNGEPGLTASNVIALSLGGVRSLELTEIEYADGSKWQSSQTSHCRATPNGFLLVAVNH